MTVFMYFEAMLCGPHFPFHIYFFPIIGALIEAGDRMKLTFDALNGLPVASTLWIVLVYRIHIFLL